MSEGGGARRSKDEEGAEGVTAATFQPTSVTSTGSKELESVSGRKGLLRRALQCFRACFGRRKGRPLLSRPDREFETGRTEFQS